jgi:hypothetical protein
MINADNDDYVRSRKVIRVWTAYSTAKAFLGGSPTCFTSGASAGAGRLGIRSRPGPTSAITAGRSCRDGDEMRRVLRAALQGLPGMHQHVRV